MLEGDEAPLSAPFWLIDSVAEAQIVDQLQRRRFSGLIDRLAEALELADPMGVVYPGNPNEYSDVVREIVVLLAAVAGDIAGVSDDQLREIFREGLARRFGEAAEVERLDEAVRLVRGTHDIHTIT